MEPIIRIKSISIKNLKNVKSGTVQLGSFFKEKKMFNQAGMLGIYGQNGSGKTAIVDAMYFLQHIMQGKTIDSGFTDYINADSETAEIMVDFYIINKEDTFDSSYCIQLRRNNEKEVYIEREYVSTSISVGEIHKNKTVFIDYQRERSNTVFMPKNRYMELINENKDYEMDLIVAKKMAEKSNCSYIFGESSREILIEKSHEDFSVYRFILMAMYHFSIADLFVIRNSHSGMISANLMLPMAFRLEKEESGIKGDFKISLTQPTILRKEEKEILGKIIEEINKVLFTIIPGLKLEIRDYGIQAMDDGTDGYKVELMSNRDGVIIPVRMESEGIIKIISILNALIHAFGSYSVCLVIDEFDAGIFEYILGELLLVFKENAKGQLIFTSHNLRALEMLDSKNIMFSTSNPEKRYIHMKNVRETNNLRDMYIRSITLGGEEEQIYSKTDSIRMARAFRKAGRSIRDVN